MRKVTTFLGASLLLVMAAPVLAQVADQFKDVPTDHWAYQAVEDLRQKGIVIGYPDGYFRGKRTLTRYEFAVALDRALAKIPAGPPGPAGEAGPAGPAGPQGEVGPPGVTPEELANFRRLAEEFRNELASLGNTVASIQRKLDALAKQVADIEARLSKMPTVYGGAWLGVRSDRANGDYVDHDGAVLAGIGEGTGAAALNSRQFQTGLANFRNSPIVLHELQLGVLANIAGGATLDAALTSNNYVNYLGGDTAVALPGRIQNPPADTYVHHLEINAPLSAIGRGSKLTFGRFGQNVSHLTLWKPEVDTYFNNPFEKDGLIYMDGARLTTNFGSVSAELFGGKTGSVRGVNSVLSGAGWSAPIAGAIVPASFLNGTTGGTGASNFVGKPIAQTNQGQFLVDELAGVSLGFGFNTLQGGHVRLTALGAAAASGNPGFVSTPITNVLVLGADADLRIAGRVVVNAEYSKSIVGTGQFNTYNIPGTSTADNNAFNATVGYSAGALNISAGYRYIDPLFYAPGYWGRIGNWVNPTNIQGPIVRASYDFTPTLGVNVGGDFFSAARNRGSVGGLTTNDDINRILVGLKFGVGKSFFTTADWEGVYYKFGNNGALAGFAGTPVHPTEHYVTLGAGYNLTSNTVLKMAYQIGSFNGHGALLSGGMNQYNFNVFTTEVGVKF